MDSSATGAINQMSCPTNICEISVDLPVSDLVSVMFVNRF